MHQSNLKKFKDLLRLAGQKATRPRLFVLHVLAKATKPLTIEEIEKKIGGKANVVTLYRMMRSLQEAGIVRQVDLQHGHAHYELKTERDHHHVVCQRCDRVEDIAGCDVKDMIRRILKRTPSFAAIRDHSFELFGLCTSCSA